MSSANPEPLWREVVGDTEPWRRGRLALIIFGVLTFLNHAIVFGADILSGNIQHLFGIGGFALLFWIQFYFIWVGIHWVRWLNAVFSGLAGFAFVIWGFRDGSTLMIATGAYLLVVAGYIGLAPSVFFFAQRQREKSRWKENLTVAAIMLLLLASLSGAASGLSAYRRQRVAEGRAFADRAFRRIFTEHDDEFLVRHVTAQAMRDIGEPRWRSLTSEINGRFGEVLEIKPAVGWLRCWYRWPATIVSEGRMLAETTDASDRPLLLQLNLGEAGGGWKISGVFWR